MPMETMQIRLPDKLVRSLDRLIRRGLYPSRSEAVRAAVREMVIAKSAQLHSSQAAQVRR